MKRLHFKFYPYIFASVGLAILAITMFAVSVVLFVSVEIGKGIIVALTGIIFTLFALWFIFHGDIVINFKKNRLAIHSNTKSEFYAIDEIKEIIIAFRFDETYMRWAANITIYLKNGKTETFDYAAYKIKFSKNGIPLYNKTSIERKAKKCNFIRCYTAK